MRGGARRGAGRKRLEIDLEQLERLCGLHCTDEEIASFFNVSLRTIQKRKKQPKFAERMERGKAKGKIALRRFQMKLAEDGNATMAVWLGKQLLGQRDVTPVEFSGPNSQEARISIEVLDEILKQDHKRDRSDH